MKITNRWAAAPSERTFRFEDECGGEPTAAGRQPHEDSGPPRLPNAHPARLVLGRTGVAGFQHHHGMHPKVLWSLREGDHLHLVREPGNPFDELAVAIYTGEGARLGYLPRGFNVPVAFLIDQGGVVFAAVEAVQPEAEPWQRVVIVLWWEPRMTLRIDVDSGCAL